MIRSIAALAAGLTVAAPHALGGQETLYDLLVSSRNSNSVIRFDGATGQYVDDFIAPMSGGLRNTQEVLRAPDGDLIVSGLGNTQILRFDYRTGAPRGAFTSGYALDGPTKMTWGPDGNLYVSQWGPSAETVAVFAPDGAFIREATPFRADPMQHAWDEDGTLLVVYWASKDVRRFDGDGQQLGIFVSDTRLQGPVNLRWDANHDLQVFDWQSGAVYTYDGSDGSYVGTFIPSVRSPEGWAIGPDGNLYIAEWTGNAVKRFDPDTGALLGVFAQGNGLAEPNSVLFVERPSVFELEASTATVRVDRGTSAELTVQVAGSRGVPFETEVELTCTPASPAVECSVTPSSVTPGATGATATVTVTAPATTSAGVPAWLLACALALFWVAAGRVPWRGPVVAVAVVLVLASCGDGTGPEMNDENGPFNTSVRVTAASDGLSERVTVAVTGE